MKALQRWLSSLAPRERLLVSAAALVVAAGAFFLFVWEPLHAGADELSQRIAGQRELASWLAAIETEAAALRRSAGAQDLKGREDSLLAVVDSSSRAAGLAQAVQRIQPEGSDQATVTIDGAGFNKMLFWLRALEHSYGVVVTSLAVTREETAGLVQARLTLKRNPG